MSKRYALGLDFGTNSCRSLIVDLEDGHECGMHVFDYPGGELGIYLDEKDPNVARQDPQDYLDGMVSVVGEAIRHAGADDPEFDPQNIIGIGVDTTGSTPIPVDRDGTPLALLPEFRHNLHAMAWLWKDHTGSAEAEQITQVAAEMHPEYLDKCGGTYSSEWFWSKVLQCKRNAPDVYTAAHSWVEHCDYIPALLGGNTDPASLQRSVCAAGHKAMYSKDWKGLPSRKLLAELDPELPDLRDRLYDKAVSSDHVAGRLCAEWAEKLGLKQDIAIAVGAFDAHMGAVGSGIREGTLVKILGTSTCDMMVMPQDRKLADIPGVCGIVNGSILPGYFGIEAGQTAVGDIFLWFVNHLVPDSYGKTQAEKFEGLETATANVKPGGHGLLALDWNNGNRCILTDARLSGLLIGQTLHSQAHEIYRALIESTAFGALTIINRIAEYGVPINEVVNCGGLVNKNPILMQIYSDITGLPMKVSRSEQTCALGAAIFGAAAAGSESSGYESIAEIQQAVCGIGSDVYKPNPENAGVYKEIYALYMTLHDAFGTPEWSGNLGHVMKDLIAIRERQR